MRKLLKWGAIVAVAGYLACGAGLYFAQRSFLYHPQYTRVPADQTDFSLRRDGLTLRGWVVNPGRDRALIYFGGNGDAVQTMRGDYAAMAPDRTVYLLAYRGYGASEGEPTEQGLLGDALALYDEVRGRHSAIAVVGRSLGSGVATWVASQRPVERLVLVTPYDSIARIAQGRFPLFPVSSMMRDPYESFRYAPRVHCPVLVLAAQDDRVIPAASTARLMQSFQPSPAYRLIEHSGHGDIVNKPEYTQAVSAFLRAQ